MLRLPLSYNTSKVHCSFIMHVNQVMACAQWLFMNYLVQCVDIPISTTIWVGKLAKQSCNYIHSYYIKMFSLVTYSGNLYGHSFTQGKNYEYSHLLWYIIWTHLQFFSSIQFKIVLQFIRNTLQFFVWIKMNQ